MLVLSLLTLLVASVSAWWSYKTQEEIVKVGTGFLSILSLLLALLFAPGILKFSLLLISLGLIGKLNRFSVEYFSNS